jgi:hypothetical protein
MKEIVKSWFKKKVLKQVYIIKKQQQQQNFTLTFHLSLPPSDHEPDDNGVQGVHHWQPHRDGVVAGPEEGA